MQKVLIFTVLLSALAACSFLRGSNDPSLLTKTSWRLVKIESEDGGKIYIENRSNYAITFLDNNKVNLKIDCNQAMTEWTSIGDTQLQFGNISSTRALCSKESLYNRIVSDFPYIRSYLLEENSLTLILMADGGRYEFEPNPN